MEFGEVVVYFEHVRFEIPLSKVPADVDQLEMMLEGQGCNKPVGVCYPPQFRQVSITKSDIEASKPSDSSPTNTAQTEFSSSKQNVEKSFWRYLAAALGAGILLSFTPCVLPMIPILAGVIAGQESPSRWRSGWLSICYVAGTIVTYADQIDGAPPLSLLLSYWGINEAGLVNRCIEVEYAGETDSGDDDNKDDN